MKRIMKVMLSLLLILQGIPSNLAFSYNYGGDYYLSQLSAIVEKYDVDDYFETMSVTIGEPNLVIDGKETPIDESGSVAYVENGRTMMPVRGIAEAIGAVVSYDDYTQTVTVEHENVCISMVIGDNEMEVNGLRVQLRTPPKIKHDRTMLPVRDVAEALDCEVEWDSETQTAIFTRAYQTKRVVVNSEYANTMGAVESFSANGKTIIQFDNIDDAKACVEINTQKGFIAEPDYIRTVQSLSWGGDMIGGDSYYNQTSYYGGSAIVAVIDTGIDYNHEMFKNRLVDGYDFWNNDNYCEDYLGHGTHVSGTVLDIAGKNKNIDIMPLKVFGEEDKTSSAIVAEAIKYATDNGANVINLSLGGMYESHVEKAAVDYANSNNVAVVAAAGNKNVDISVTDYTPAGIDGVITVSAMTEYKTIADFSNYGEGVIDFTAAGVNINSARNGGGYIKINGTSMASPHVAGAYALVKANHPDLPTEEITAALKKNAHNLGYSKYFGAGIINVDMLERHLSALNYSHLKVSGVTRDNAVISGKIGYKGIVPNIIGVEIDGRKVYSQRYTPNINDEMDFKCDLNNDARYILKPGTTHDARIFTSQGEHITVTDTIRFTTQDVVETPIPDPAPTPVPDPTPTPVPDPEPQPYQSELKIIPQSYPTGTLEQGAKYNLSGRIKSNYHITDVRSYILDETKNIVQEAKGSTTTATYVIEGSNLDVGLRFERLQPGKYYLRYAAEDETGNRIIWTGDAFYIKQKIVVAPVEPTVTGVVLIPDSYDNLSIRSGPSTGYAVIGSMNHTVKCTVYTNKTENGWYYVDYNGIKGYASGNYIYLPSETRTGIVSIPSSWDNLSIRSGPSTNYRIVGSMNNGVRCTVYPDKASGGWDFVEYGGVYGYASGNYIN